MMSLAGSLRHRVEVDGGLVVERPNGLVINFPDESKFVHDEHEGYVYLNERTALNKKPVTIVKPALAKRPEGEDIDLNALIADKRKQLAPIVKTEELVRSILGIWR